MDIAVGIDRGISAVPGLRRRLSGLRLRKGGNRSE
jgi:hypothetical protein